MSCGRTKSLDSFTRNKNMVDGRLNRCKICHNARMKKYRVKEKNDPFTRALRLYNTKKEDWCMMWDLLAEMGYDLEKDVHEQFAMKYSVPFKEKPPERIKSYNHTECRKDEKIKSGGAQIK